MNMTDELLVRGFIIGKMLATVALAKEKVISCKDGAEMVNISVEELIKLVALDNPRIKIEEIARERVSNISIDEMRKISDDINRAIRKKEIAEIKEKLERLDKEFLGKIYKRKEEYKDLEDFYKVIAISNWGKSVKALRIARPEKKWITAPIIPRPLSDEDVAFGEDCFATLENIPVMELQSEYQEISIEEWEHAYAEFLLHLKKFSNIEIDSEELYV